MSPQDWDGIHLEEAPADILPKCPYCQKPLEKLWLKKRGIGVWEQKQIVMCPYCEALLGYGVFGQR